ncbi:MAG: glycosyltransferase family 25 protein [Cyclobacteriaceae bacterium]
MVENRLKFFHQINDYFDKVYVVTIPRLKDRQAHMNLLLEGLDFEFINGTDKHELDVKDFETLYDEKEHLRLSRFKKPLRPGEIACALSHLQVYQNAVENGFERVLVLEDDIDIVEAHLSQLAVFLEHLPKKWELAYLGYWKNEKRPKLAWVKQFGYVLLSIVGFHKWSVRRILNTYPKPIDEEVLESGNHEGAYAYAVSLGGCKKLLAYNRPIKLNADNLFSHLATNRYLKAYISAKKIFAHRSQNGIGAFSSETGN